MNIEPTPEELFYAKMAGSAVGDFASVGQFIDSLAKHHVSGLITAQKLLENLRLLAMHIERGATEYTKQAEDFSKTCFLKRLELSGESPAAPKSQAN